MLVRIDEEQAVEMLVERVSYWTQDSEITGEGAKNDEKINRIY